MPKTMRRASEEREVPKEGLTRQRLRYECPLCYTRAKEPFLQLAPVSLAGYNSAL